MWFFVVLLRHKMTSQYGMYATVLYGQAKNNTGKLESHVKGLEHNSSSRVYKSEILWASYRFSVKLRNACIRYLLNTAKKSWTWQDIAVL